jgi:hypothetical protein
VQGGVGGDRVLPGLLLGEVLKLGQQRRPLVVPPAVEGRQFRVDVGWLDPSKREVSVMAISLRRSGCRPNQITRCPVEAASLAAGTVRRVRPPLMDGGPLMDERRLPAAE